MPAGADATPGLVNPGAGYVRACTTYYRLDAKAGSKVEELNS